MKRYFPHHRLGTYLRPLPSHNVIYVKNPKAGCSAILVWLDRIHTGEHDVEFVNVHKEHRLPTVHQVGRRVVLAMLSGAAYRFSFVRNPLSRFESVYWDKLVNKAHNWGSDIRVAMGLEAHGAVSFERFLTAVEQQDPITEMDPHWRPQHVNLLHPLITYDHVGRLESLADDLERICEEAGLPYVPIEVRNASRRPVTHSVYDGRPDLVRRVEQIYATDFDLYGY
jgi:hypothetical protein